MEELKGKAHMSRFADLTSSIQELIKQVPFSCSGFIEIKKPPAVVILPSSDETLHPVRVVFHELENNTELARTFLERTSISKFRRGSKDVLDPTYRTAVEFSHEQLLFENFEFLDDVVNQVAIGLGVSSAIRIKPFKLCIYEKDGFFNSHQDTPVDSGMLGTLVVCLDSSFSGGKLHISRNSVLHHEDDEIAAAGSSSCGVQEKDNNEQVLDWASIVKKGVVAWGAFYGDCKHSIDKVTDGLRITMTYQLFDVQKEEDRSPNTSVFIPDPLLQMLSTMVAKPPLCIKKKKNVPDSHYAFLRYGCVHEYPMAVGDSLEGIIPKLRGVDAVVYECMKRANPAKSPLVFLYNKDLQDTIVEDIVNGYYYDFYDDEEDCAKFETQCSIYSRVVEELTETYTSHGEGDKDEAERARNYIVCAGPVFDLVKNNAFRYEDWMNASTGNGGIDTSVSYRRLVIVCPTSVEYTQMEEKFIEILKGAKYRVTTK